MMSRYFGQFIDTRLTDSMFSFYFYFLLKSNCFFVLSLETKLLTADWVLNGPLTLLCESVRVGSVELLQLAQLTILHVKPTLLSYSDILSLCHCWMQY